MHPLVAVLALLAAPVAAASDGNLRDAVRTRLPVAERTWLAGTSAPASLHGQYVAAR